MNSFPDTINGCKNGDRKSQEQLYRSYYASMIKLCIRYTKSEEDAVEVLNNAFLRIFKYIDRYEPGKASLYTWIRTIVVNSCIDFLKLKEKKLVYEKLDGDMESCYIDAEVISRMKVNQLLQFTRQLPKATMAVFNLYVMEGYTHKEIAELLYISEGTSKWHLSEARKNLKQMISLQEVKI